MRRKGAEQTRVAPNRKGIAPNGIDLKRREKMDRISWDEFKSSESYSHGETWTPINVSCPKCGEQLQRREDMVLTSYPPMRQYRCPVCGWKGVK